MFPGRPCTIYSIHLMYSIYPIYWIYETDQSTTINHQAQDSTLIIPGLAELHFEYCQNIKKLRWFHPSYKIVVNIKLKQSSQRAYVGKKQGNKCLEHAYLGEIQPVPALFEQIENNAPRQTKSWLKATRIFIIVQELSGSGVCHSFSPKRYNKKESTRYRPQQMLKSLVSKILKISETNQIRVLLFMPFVKIIDTLQNLNFLETPSKSVSPSTMTLSGLGHCSQFVQIEQVPALFPPNKPFETFSLVLPLHMRVGMIVWALHSQ